MKNWKKTIIKHDKNLKDAIINLNSSALKICIVVNNFKNFVGTITDGDIRRSLINGVKLTDSIKKVVNTNSLKVPGGLGNNDIIEIMKTNRIQHLPEVNKNNKVINLHSIEDFINPINKNNQFIIMAGGKGTRLLPLTKKIPKPMLKIAGKPMIEHLILKARDQGFINFVISVNYLKEKIKKHFGNGKKIGVNIQYIEEKKPLGTAGALSIFKTNNKSPSIIVNSDLLTKINFNEVLEYHIKNNADATMAVGIHEITNPYGVIKLIDNVISEFNEKPTIKNYINAGIYILNNSMLKFLKKNQNISMIEFFKILKSNKKKIIAYPLHEPWIDLGDFKNFTNSKSLIHFNKIR
tara:strand:+ start:221 stop:1273 length:1053 start_codon:yes stop_codon:yes gene_type:complete